MKVGYIPNILSSLRIAMAASFFLVFVCFPEKKHIAALIFIAAGITDILDGFLARRFGWISDAGKILDPIADKTMQITALLCCTAGGFVPLWLLIFVALKELVMGVGSLIFYKKFKAIGVSRGFGKVYTVLFYVVICAFILFDGWFSAHQSAKFVLCLATAVSGWMAIVLYYITYLKGKLKG